MNLYLGLPHGQRDRWSVVANSSKMNVGIDAALTAWGVTTRNLTPAVCSNQKRLAATPGWNPNSQPDCWPCGHSGRSDQRQRMPYLRGYRPTAAGLLL